VRIVSESTEVLSSIEHLSGLIELLSNVRSVKPSKQPKTSVEIAINKSKVGAAFKRESAEALSVLGKVPSSDIAAWLSGKEDSFKSGKFQFAREMVEMKESAEGFAIASFEGGKIFLKTEMKKELYEEAMVRESARRVQIMRKEKKLVESDSIALHLHSEDKELMAIIKKHSDEIARQVNASSVGFSIPSHSAKKEWEIGEATLAVSIEKK
jgi:hypothetical protein